MRIAGDAATGPRRPLADPQRYRRSGTGH